MCVAIKYTKLSDYWHNFKYKTIFKIANYALFG